MTTNVDESAAQLIRNKIEKLIYEFFYFLDERRYRQLSDMFAPDGVWHRQGKQLRGPDSVMGAMERRPVGFTTRHLITNVMVDVDSADAATARYYMTVFVHEGTEAPKAAVPMAVPMHVSSFEQKFVNRGGQWLIGNSMGSRPSTGDPAGHFLVAGYLRMKAVIIDEGAAERPLVFREDVPDPIPKSTDLLIAVRAAALNRADLRRAATHFASSEGSKGLAVAGLELAGEVIAIGSEVKGFSPGDRVMAMSGGAYAERAVVDYQLAIPVPVTFDWKQAAATPITFVTAYDALMSAAQFKAGESVLVQGASTGAGIAAIQIARWKGAKHISGTASSAKLQRIRGLGCTVPIDYTAENVADIVMKHTDKHGVEVVLDHVGDKAVQTSIAAAAIKARIVCVGRVAGVEATINVDEFSRKRIHMIGVTFRTRSMDERTEVIRGFCADVLPELDRGGIGPVIDSVYPLKEAARAQEHMRGNQHFGKIILIP